MSKLNLLNKIKEIYDNGENVLDYLKNLETDTTTNSVEDILISYDFQAGSYYDYYKDHLALYEQRCSAIAENINQCVNGCTNYSLMEAGIGEATILGPVLQRLERTNDAMTYGFDLSWSRLKYAEKFLNELLDENHVNLFVGDMFNIPIKDNSIDVVFTTHSIEPNGGKEREILQELYRITSKYLILFEPAYELADEESRARMKRLGYVTDLYNTAISLGYNVKSYKLLGSNLNPLNPTGVLVIEKNNSKECNRDHSTFCDPISMQPLILTNEAAYCNSSMLMYPIISGIPCLLKSNAIIATKFNDFI